MNRTWSELRWEVLHTTCIACFVFAKNAVNVHLDRKTCILVLLISRRFYILAVSGNITNLNLSDWDYKRFESQVFRLKWPLILNLQETNYEDFIKLVVTLKYFQNKPRVLKCFLLLRWLMFCKPKIFVKLKMIRFGKT